MRHLLPLNRTPRFLLTRVAPLAMAVAASASLSASPLSDYDRALVEQTDEKVRQILNQVSIDDLDTTQQNPYMDSMRLEAESAVADNTLIQEMQAEKAAEKAEEFYQDHDILVFASLSLTNDGLEDILALASTDPGIMVVFRGVPEGMKIDDGMRVMHQLAYQFDPVPNIAIDPTLFDKHNVSAVPTIVKYAPLTLVQRDPGTVLPDMGAVVKGELSVDDALASVENTPRVAGRDIIGRVEGLTRPEWMEQRIAMGEKGDFGNQGPTKEIAEPDLIEVMKRQAMMIDWEHEKTAAIDRFWQRQSDKFLYFPPANQERTRLLSPIVEVTADIRDADGKVLVAKGATFNQLDTTPFDMGLVIFDATDEGQVEVALQQRDELEARDDIRQVVFMMTDMETLDGWDVFEALSDRFDRPLHLLTPDVAERFEIEKTPTVITATATHFEVKEMVASRLGSLNAGAE